MGGLFLYRQILQAVFFLELINTSAGIQEFLFAREERMASGANFDADVRTNRTRFERVAASASRRRHMILWLDGLFQRVHLFLPWIACGSRVLDT